jgi:hypothetical protein
MSNPEKYIGQRRIWISKPDDGFADEFLGRIFRISGIKTDMAKVVYFTYYYGIREKDNRRDVKDILEHSAEISPVLKELFD